MRRAWNEFRFVTRRLLALPFRALCLARNVLRQKIARRRLVIVMAAFLVCAYTGGVLGYVWLFSPDIGVRCAFTPTINHFNRGFLIKGEEPEGDDTITQLGNQDVSNWAQILHELAELRREKPEPGTEADLTSEAEKTHLLVDGKEIVRVRYKEADTGKTQTVWLRVGQPPLETLLPSILWFALKILLFAVGAYVFWKRPEDRSAATFFLFCLASFGAYMGGYHWSRIVTQPALILVFIVCSVLLPAVSLHFYLVFPRPKAILDRAPKRVLFVLYGPPVFFLLLLISGYFGVRWLYFQPDDSVRRVGKLLDVLLFAIYCYFGVAVLWYLASVVCLVHSYRTSAGTTERNQVKWILYGTLASLAPIGYSLYLALAQRQRFGGGEATWPMFIASVCVTAAFTISITRYRLMQLDQLISSGVRYFLFSSAVGLVYYSLIFGGMMLLGSIEGPTFGQVVAASGTALIFLIGLNLFRDRFTAALNRHFRREKHQLDRMLQRMSQVIEQLVDSPTLAHRLLHTSVELLGASGGAVYLRQGDPPLYRLTEAVGPDPALDELSSGCPLIETLVRYPLSAVRYPPNLTADSGQRQLHFLGGTLAQALVHEGQLLGILILAGPLEPRGLATETTGGYTAEDLHLLAAFAQMTVLALVSAEGHRKIDVLNRELQTKIEKIAEQQRRIMALQTQLSAVRHPPSAIRQSPAALDGQQTANGERPMAESGVIGSSVQVHHLMQLVRKVAVTDSVVLLRGESGTGKELLARAIHDNSPRTGKPFVAVHCSALSPSLLESELFGHVKGAFTNAIRDKVGRFEAANGGTLFLDEIGDIALEVQIKLLRVLQERMFERVGSSEPLRVDVRIIAATHQDLEALMRQGRFREDLFFRLDVFSIALPPLRKRAEDVPELALHFLRLYSQRMSKQVDGIDDDAMSRLKAYPWPGNIRQLENVIQRAVVVAEKPLVTVEELPVELHADPFPLATRTYRTTDDDSLEETLREAADHWSPLLAAAPTGLTAAIHGERIDRERREREKFVRALAAAGGNKSEAARALGMARSTFISRLKRLGLT
jgi:transcriptional regulator with GAF, ATPase, and Fis domain